MNTPYPTPQPRQPYAQQPPCPPPQPAPGGAWPWRLPPWVPQARRAYSRTGLALLAMAGITALFQILAALWLYILWPGAAQTGWYIWVISFVPQYAIALPVTVLLFRKLVPASRPADHGLRPGQLVIAFFISIGIMSVGNLLGSGLSLLFTGGQAENPLNTYVSQVSALQILVVVILAPLVEEYVFRRLIIDRLAPYGGALAVLASGLCFGLYHMNLFQFFYATGLGLVFGYLYLHTSRLRYTIALHMAVNFLGGAVAPLLLAQVDLTALEWAVAQQDTVAIFRALQSMLPLLVYEAAFFCAAIAGIILLLCKIGSLRFPPAPCPLPRGCRRVTVLNVGMPLFGLLCVLLMILSLLA